MNWFDWSLWITGAFVLFTVAGAALLFVLAWASDKWDNRHTGGEDEQVVQPRRVVRVQKTSWRFTASAATEGSA